MKLGPELLTAASQRVMWHLQARAVCPVICPASGYTAALVKSPRFLCAYLCLGVGWDQRGQAVLSSFSKAWMNCSLRKSS